MLYDASKTTTLYVEDLTDIEAAVQAIEETVGYAPQGLYATVTDRLNDVDQSLAGKQAALGFTAENVANKDTATTLGTSDTKYPSQKAVKSYVDAAALSIMSTLYPVGSIYTNATISTNPGTYLGFGTWAAFGEGRVLVSKATTGTFGTAGATGGEETHTLSIAEMPSHNHYSIVDAAVSDNRWGLAWATTNGYHAINGNTGSSGGGAAHNNLQPYIVVYMWRRTA